MFRFLFFIVSCVCLLALPSIQSVKAAKSKPILYFVQSSKWHIVLEKIDHKNYDKWISFLNKQEANFKKVTPINPAIKKILPSVCGIEKIRKCMENYKALKTYDLYIAYVMSESPENLTDDKKFGTATTGSAIKMLISVQASKDLPYYSPFGITRTVDDAIQISEHPSGPEFHHMPIQMYSYTYYMMQKLYPQINSILSAPPLKIRRIYQKFLPREAFTLGKTLEHLPMPWKTKDTFIYDHEHDVNYFQGPVLTKISGQAFLDYIDKNP